MKVCPVCNLKYADEESRCFVDRTELRNVADPRIGMLIGGRYLVEAAIGEGGMAVVYRARQQLVDRSVAIKIMNPQLSGDGGLKERFRREAKNAAALAHPNIVEILDYGETEEGVPFLVMELLQGAPLDSLIESGPLPPGQVALLGAQIARGLARAHDFQVIHRDLKPENVFVARLSNQQPLAKILDFGIARSMHDQRLTSQGQVFGTPQYMAPERVTSIDTGPAADLYALGVMLFEMVTGELPFKATELTGYLIAHLQEPAPRASTKVPSIPRRLDDLIWRLMAKKPEERPVDAHQVEKELIELAPEHAAATLATTQLASTQRQVAPTLPPTTLERWAHRIHLFEDMLRAGFPQGNVPELATKMLNDIRKVVGEVTTRRAEGLKDQRELETMEQSAREGRARMGHAMSMLGQDLSQARTALRQAEGDVRPYLVADDAAREAYSSAFKLVPSHALAGPLTEPQREVSKALRDVADALDRWAVTHAGSAQARAWLLAKQAEAKDLEFQTDALRAQLERLENQYETARGSLEARLRENGVAIDKLDRKLNELGSGFVLPLRPKAELTELFQKLERESMVPPPPGGSA